MPVTAGPCSLHSCSQPNSAPHSGSLRYSKGWAEGPGSWSPHRDPSVSQPCPRCHRDPGSEPMTELCSLVPLTSLWRAPLGSGHVVTRPAPSCTQVGLLLLARHPDLPARQTPGHSLTAPCHPGETCAEAQPGLWEVDQDGSPAVFNRSLGEVPVSGRP